MINGLKLSQDYLNSNNKDIVEFGKLKEYFAYKYLNQSIDVLKNEQDFVNKYFDDGKMSISSRSDSTYVEYNIGKLNEVENRLNNLGLNYKKNINNGTSVFDIRISDHDKTNDNTSTLDLNYNDTLSTLNSNIKYSKPLEVSSKEDSDGDKVSQGMLDYMKGTKLTKDGALMKIYHTGRSLFEDFNPTKTTGYRFGNNIVNYFSNSETVSGSYTNGEYKQINKANYEKNEKVIANYRTKLDEWNKAFKTFDDNKNVVGRKMFDYINNYRDLFNGMDDILYEVAYGENKLDLNAYDQIMLEDYRDNIRQFLSSDTPSKAFRNGSYLTKLIDSYNNSVSKNTVSKEFVDLFNNNKNYVEMINEMKQYYDANNELYNDYQNINKELENYRRIVEGGNQYVGYGLAKNPYVINGNKTNWNEINNSDYWLDVDIMNKVGNDFIEMVNKEEENGDRDAYDILLSRRKKYKAEEFIINNMPTDSKQFLIDNPIVLANLTNIFYNPYSYIENEVGYQFNRNVGTKQVGSVQTPIMKFGDRLETNDVVRAVLTINQYLKDNGQEPKYDSVVFENIRDSGSSIEGSYEPSDVIALFNSNQFKLIDNENPTTDKRIRYAKNLDNQGTEINSNMQEFLKDSIGDREDPYDINSPHMRWKHGTYKGDFTQFLGKGDTRTYFDWERGKYEQETSKNGAIYLTASPEMARSYSNTNKDIDPYNINVPKTINDVKSILKKNNLNIKKKNGIYYVEGKAEDIANYLVPNAEMDTYYTLLDELEEGTNGNRLYYLGSNAKETIDQLINANGIMRGNYNLYAKSENPYIIDAKGKKWYEIVIPTEMLNSGDMRDWYNEGDYVDTRTIENWFYDNLYGKGYDSIRIQNVIDNGQFGGQITPSDILIVFDSANVKDINNQNPTSNKDIRYSKPLDSEDKYVSYATKRQERTIDDNLVNGGMNPKYLNNEDYLAARNALINNANETNGNIDVKYMMDLKDVVENYLTIDEEIETDSVDVRSYLKSNPINPSILDSEGLRKKNTNIFDDKNSTGIDRKDFMNKMRSIGVVWSNKGTTSVDTLAQELSDLYPQLSFLNDKTSHYDILNALYDYANNNKNNTKELSLIDLYGQDAMNNFANNFKKAILDVDSIAKQINDQNRLTISDEDLSKFVKGKKLSEKTLATIQKYKTELADNAPDWVPDYDIIAQRYPSFSKENLSTALFEIFENGNLSEETKEALKDNIIATEFNGNKEQYLDSKRTNEINNLINDAIEYFSVDAKYQANQSELDKTANRANQYIKAYTGIDATQDIEQKFDDIKQMQDMEKRIKDAREKTSKSYVKTLQDMVTLAKDKISRWKTLEQNLDVMAGGALDLRKGMQEVFELPKYQAQTTNAALLTEGDKYIQEKVKQGFREGSKESKATQWYLEGHTDELVELSQVEDPRTLSDQDSNKKVYKPFTEEDLKSQFNYKMDNGKYAYENIIEYANELRERYDDLIYQTNSTRVNQIYGDIEGKNDLETTKLLAKVNTQNEVVKQLANRMVKEKPSVELQSAYNQAKQEFNKLANQYNKKIEKNQSNDSTRRQLVPYRQNYAPHVIEKGNFLQQLRNAINSENKTPTDLAGISDYAKPRSTFAGFMMAQEGGDYTADATAGFAQYIKEASRVIAYDPLVDYYRNIAKDLRDLTKGTTLNDFDEYLNDYTNSLAGKTNEFDRGGKKMFGTKALKVVDVLNKRAKANSLMFNFRTMVVQAANLPNAMSVLQGNGGAKVTQDIARGTYNYLSNITNENALDKQSPFLTMRYADIDTGDLSFKAKAEKVANFMMEKVDEISTKSIWYSAYEQGIRKGVDDAIFYADDLTRRSVAGRDVGEVPLALQSKFINLAMPFQVETQNVWNTMGGLLKDKKFGAILTSLIAGWLMNNLYEKLFGDRPIFDPIDAIKDGIKASEGGEYQNLVTRLAGEVIGANPIATSAISFALDEDQRETLFGEQDPTKYGTTNNSVQALGKAIVQAYESKNLKSLETLLYAYGLPGGGTQAKRIVQTLQTYGILPQQVSGEWLNEPISYTDSGKIRYANDTEINAENVLDFMKQLAFGTWAGKQGQAYLEDGKYLSDSQSNIFDAFNSGLSAYQSYSLTKEYANIESLKDENGKTITNSEGLQKRALLQENGVWEDYKENNEAGKNNIGKTVYNMTDDEFQKAYEEVFGKAVEQPQETKETKNVEQEQSSMKDIFSGLFNKDETIEETPKETNIDNMESSTSGNLYPNGKKPTQEDYLNGLENFYEEGDYRYTPNDNGGYDLQEWNGSEFVTTKKNAIKGETKKVTEKETNNKTNKTTKEVTLQDAYEQTFTKAQINNYIKAMAGGKENSTYKAISNVLNKHVNGKSTKEVQDNIDEIRKSYKKAGVYEIVKKYLKNHPYVDARKFGL